MSVQNDITILAICVIALGVVYLLAVFLKRKDDEELNDLPTYSDGIDTSNVEVKTNLNESKAPLSISLGTGVERPVLSPFVNWDRVEFDIEQPEAVKAKKRTGKSSKPELVNVNFGAVVVKIKKGKTTLFGCSLCPDKKYKHAPSAHNHIRAKH